MKTNIGVIAKAIVAFLVGIVGWATAVVQSPSGPITATEWIGLATVVAVAVGVFTAPNQTQSG